MHDLTIKEDNHSSFEKAMDDWEFYQKLCGSEGILEDSDFQEIKVKQKDETGVYVETKRKFRKKSAWQKLGRAFNVNTKIVERELQRTKTGRISEAYYCICATLPNGRSVESDALCSRSEKGKSKVSDHTIMSTAKTRATNRAISELIGAGEVSAEEMGAEHKIDENPVDNLIDTNAVVGDDDIVEPEIVPEKATKKTVTNTGKCDDPVHNTCIQIKKMLEKDGKNVNKSTMKAKVIRLCQDGTLPAENRVTLIEYIQKHCPEELE